MPPIERTQTPQKHFPHVGVLENQGAIAAIAMKMLENPCNGLGAACVTKQETELLHQFATLLSEYQSTSRAQWAALKESCLLLLGSPIASTVDHLISAMRTPAIAESAIRSAGFALIDANQAKAKPTAQQFMRTVLRESIGA